MEPTNRSASRMTRRAFGLNLLAGMALVGCGSIPTKGSVNHYADPAQSATPTQASLAAEGPTKDASPEEIIRGFINAGIGANDDYTVAREFLTGGFADSWKPDDSTLVHSAQISINQAAGKGKFTVNIPVTTSIDSRGLATSFEEPDNKETSFSLIQVDGQWRISDAPNGTILERSDFEQIFTPFNLYFFDSTFTYSVPDVRWFADRSTVATSLTRVLLQGPAPYLENAVASAVPAGTKLGRNSVPVENGTAQVYLESAGGSQAPSQLDIERLNVQLTQTLSHLNGVHTVQFSLDNQNLDTGKLENFVEPQINPSVGQQVIGLHGDQLVLRSDLMNESEDQPVYSGSESMQHPAMGYKRQNFAFLNKEHTEVFWVNNEGKAVSILQGPDVTAPSFDQYQWLWASTHDGKISVYSVATTATKTAENVSADWLKSYAVASLKISRDGARALIVTLVGNRGAVWVSGIQRDAENKPTQLTQPIRLGTTIDASDAHWYSDSSVLVADYVTGKSQIVSLSGELTDIGALNGMMNVVSGSGNNSAIAQTTDSSVYLLVDYGWSRVDVQLQDVSYSG